MKTLEETSEEYVEAKIKNGPDDTCLFASRTGIKQMLKEAFIAGSVFMKAESMKKNDTTLEPDNVPGSQK